METKKSEIRQVPGSAPIGRAFVFAVLASLTLGTWNHALAFDVNHPSDCGGHIKETMSIPKAIINANEPTAVKAINVISSSLYMGTFSITGTTVCLDKAGAYLLAQRQRQEDFARANVLALSQGIAQGGNEEMNVLIGLMGCPQDVAPRLSALAQEHYAELVPSPAFGGAEVMGGLRRVVRADAELSGRCAWV